MTRLFSGVTAGVILAVFLMGCGPPEYRLDGASQMNHVMLLDPGAKRAVDSLQADFVHVIDLLALSEASAIDSMKKSASSLGPSIQRAQRSLRDAQGKYKTEFQKMQRFRSFGGNPVFSSEDVGVTTKKLQAEILGRFYKGKAFSLETQGQIRSFIRKELVPLEKQVNQAKSRVNRLRRTRSGRTKSTGEIVVQYQKKRHQLLEETNLKIKHAILEHKKRAVQTDSVGEYVFERIPFGQYNLYAEGTDSTGYLATLNVMSHTRQDLLPLPSLAIGVSIANPDSVRKQ